MAYQPYEGLAKADHTHKMKQRGWMLPYLLEWDVFPGVGHRRWEYWLTICQSLQLPDEPIPRIEFSMWPENTRFEWPEVFTEKSDQHVKRMLEPCVQRAGIWWDEAWLLFVRWLLHGFGDPQIEAERQLDRIAPELQNYWYEEFKLPYLWQTPIDWSAHILEGRFRWLKQKGRARWADSAGFFATPMNLCNCMVEMLFMGGNEEVDQRLLTVLEPCCGTGSMLLPASNYSLRMWGVDIIPDLVLCAKVNGYLWMPWMVCHPPYVKEALEELAGERAPTEAPPIFMATTPQDVAMVETGREQRRAQLDMFGYFDTEQQD